MPCLLKAPGQYFPIIRFALQSAAPRIQFSRRVVMADRCGIVAVLLVLVAGCSTYKESGGDPRSDPHPSLHSKVQQTIASFRARDPGLDRFFKFAHGYAVYPTVGKGGLIVGAAYGRGEVFEQGRVVGITTLTQATVGAQIGGQVYSEIIFFKSPHTLDDFKRGNFEFSGQASGVAMTVGASADADFEGGVAVFTMPKSGLMGEASIGGQKFSFEAR
jgi:lipid-binding SYLF domain-containing protein